MNREIEFRGWSEKLQIMYTSEMNEEAKNLWAIPKASGGIITMPDWILMQFTGLKDKNGKKIFEGDILKGKTYKEVIVERTSKEIIGQVKWGNHFGQECFYLSVDLPCGFRTYPNLLTCEVIGNVYENPELLNK